MFHLKDLQCSTVSMLYHSRSICHICLVIRILRKTRLLLCLQNRLHEFFTPHALYYHCYSLNSQTIMGILLWIIFGAIAGWLASMITNSNNGLVLDIVIGIVGAVVGGWIMSMLGSTGVSGFNLYSLLVAILGAVVLLVVVKAIRRA
jgi:uncharacterized membrane protein YeaQ/YmgE (transglycosylase-associated protein family)